MVVRGNKLSLFNQNGGRVLKMAWSWLSTTVDDRQRLQSKRSGHKDRHFTQPEQELRTGVVVPSERCAEQHPQ